MSQQENNVKPEKKNNIEFGEKTTKKDTTKVDKLNMIVTKKEKE